MTLAPTDNKKAETTCRCGLSTITSETGENGDAWKAVRVTQVQVTKRHVQAICAVRGCTVPVASVSCRSHLHTYHDNTVYCSRAYKSSEGRGDGKGGMDQPVRGPGVATKGMLGGTPAPAGSWSRDW